MTSSQVRTSLFLLGICVLAAAAGFQVVRSLPHAAVFYIVGLILVFAVLEPFVGMIAYLALYYVRVLWLIPGFGEFPLMLVVGGGVFASMFLRKSIQHRGVSPLSSPPDYVLMWFVVAIALSHLTNGRGAYGVTAVYGFLHCVVAYLLITNLVTDVRRLDITMHCLAVLVIWVAVEALIVHYRGVGIGGMEPVKGRVRALGFTGDPNTLAGGMLLLVPFFFMEMTSPGRVLRRFGSAVAVAVLSYVVILTESRGGAVTLAVVSMILLVKRFGIRTGVVLFLFVASALYFLGPSRFQNLNPTEPSTFGRLIAWKRAFGEFFSRPLFGIGSQMSGGIGESVPHNGFMQTAAELGVFGLIPWLLFIMVPMKNALFVSRRAVVDQFGRLALLSEAFFFASLVWVTTLLSVGSPYYPELYIVVGLCVAAGNIFVRSSGARFVVFERRDVGYAVLLAGFLLGVHRTILLIVGL